jgi:hypothetical protein
VIEIRRADSSDDAALSAIRRSAILELAVAAMSPSQAEQWANQAAADRVTRAILHHAVWVAVQGVPLGWVEVDKDRVASRSLDPDAAPAAAQRNLVNPKESAP